MGKYDASSHSKAENDNHANQGNRNTDVYWQSRGEKERPEDWEEVEDDEE